MKAYTVKQLAKIAGVSVRTLHYYDEINLLKPSSRSLAGYRQYGESDLLRLQQILFFKELNFPLDKISHILDDPDFDQVEALQTHRRWLQQQSERLGVLLQTIDKTLLKLTEAEMSLTDEELYEGFTQEQVERYEKEVEDQYDPELVKESKRRIGKMSKAQWQGIKTDGDEVTRLIASLADREPSDPAVQAAIARHHAWIENFYPAAADVYRGLGSLYTGNDEFRQNYDKYRRGLTNFMQAAMTYYADNTLK